MTADQIQEQINANSAEQSQLYQDSTLDSYAKSARLHTLRERQSQLFVERTKAQFAERGIQPTRLH